MLVTCGWHRRTPRRQASLPDGLVNLIIPVAPGGGTDLTFRALAEATRKHLDRNILVVNLTGAGGAVGLSQAAIKPANGLNINSYTSEIFTLPVFQPLSFSGKDFRPILLVNEDPACLVVPADSKMDTLEAFIAEAKARPGRVASATPATATSGTCRPRRSRRRPASNCCRSRSAVLRRR